MIREYWRRDPLRKRLERAAAEYETTREYPMLFGMQQSMQDTANQFGLQEEALRAYLEARQEKT